jgi:malate dehydrogenase (oxaloacetate-decarboxylating)(NADP+)
MYVFPGIGLGSILCKARHISQEMVRRPLPSHNPPLTNYQIYTSAVALSSTLTNPEFESGMLYPDLTRIRSVSVVVAREVIREAQRQNLDSVPELRNMSDEDLDVWIAGRMYDPRKDDGSEGSEQGSGQGILESLGAKL